MTKKKKTETALSVPLKVQPLWHVALFAVQGFLLRLREVIHCNLEVRRTRRQPKDRPRQSMMEIRSTKLVQVHTRDESVGTTMWYTQYPRPRWIETENHIVQLREKTQQKRDLFLDVI